jgi:hypothetical protein
MAGDHRLLSPAAERGYATAQACRHNQAHIFHVYYKPTVIENLEELSIAEAMQQFDVIREQSTAVLEFVAQSLGTEPVPTGAHPL